MKTSDFSYELPQELIAQDPLENRASSRLLVLNRGDGSLRHDTFSRIGDYLQPGDCLVLNDTRVIPARLIGVKEDTGAAVEILLLKQVPSDTPRIREEAHDDPLLSEARNDCMWETLVRPGKKLREGARVKFGDGALRAEIISVLPDGNRLVRFTYDGIWEEVLDALGEMPLPPYITHKLTDRERYQTVYAVHEGSAAAPTAGLHFTKELLASLEEKGIRTAFVTLHVGLGTFRPVKATDVTDHHMHSEWYRVTEDTARMIRETKASGHRVVCVGTTSVRTLETVAAGSEDGEVHASSGDTSIFIYPGFSFRVTDALITNFHLPESTLLMLVSAFAGRENVLSSYAEAVRERYRFFSFGDAMLIV